MAETNATAPSTTNQPSRFPYSILMAPPAEVEALPFELRTTGLLEIDPRGASRHFLPGQMEAMLDNARVRGIHPPILVRELPAGAHPFQYELLDGQKRLDIALRLHSEMKSKPKSVLDYPKIPIKVVTLSDSEARSIEFRRSRQDLLYRVFGLETAGPNFPLCDLAEAIEKPSELPLEIEELDRIADRGADGLESEDWTTLADMSWFDGVLRAVEWWRNAFTSLLYIAAGDSSDFDASPPFIDNREMFTALIKLVFEAYIPAMMEGPHFAAGWDGAGDACVELLKRYRTFTRYVCTFAQTVLPDVNLAKMLDRP